jgi:hypothetical protein
MFYIIIFSILAVILVAGGIAGMSRRRKGLEHESPHHVATKATRQNRNRKRAQSRHDRRKRH